MNFITIYHFYQKRMKIEKVEKLVGNLHDKAEYVIHIRNLKQALNHGIVLKKVHIVNKFNQNAWLKAYIDMNTNIRKRAKNDFEKNCFKLMNAVFGKTMENVRKHRGIIRTKLSYYEAFHIISINNRNETQILLNKPVC